MVVFLDLRRVFWLYYSLDALTIALAFIDPYYTQYGYNADRLPDPDCVREDPFWREYQAMLTKNLELEGRFDVISSRYALNRPGCPLGKMSACLLIYEQPELCFDQVPISFLEMMGSRWPILAILDQEQQRRTNAQANFGLGVPWSTFFMPPDENGNLPMHPLPLGEEFDQYKRNKRKLVEYMKAMEDGDKEKQKRMQDADGDDCEIPVHSSLVWNDFQTDLHYAVNTATEIFMRSNHRIDRGHLNRAMDFGAGVVWKAASNTALQGKTVAFWTNMCVFGVESAMILRAFGMLLSESDIFRGVERIFQGASKFFTDSHIVGRLLNSKWRILGLLQAVSILKRHRLDLPAEVLDHEPTAQEEKKNLKPTGGTEKNLNKKNNNKSANKQPVVDLATFSDESALAVAGSQAADRLRRVARRNRLLLVPMKQDRPHRVGDFMGRALEAREDGGVALVVESPYMMVACKAGVREGFLKAANVRDVIQDLLIQDIDEGKLQNMQFRMVNGEMGAPMETKKDVIGLMNSIFRDSNEREKSLVKDQNHNEMYMDRLNAIGKFYQGDERSDEESMTALNPARLNNPFIIGPTDEDLARLDQFLANPVTETLFSRFCLPRLSVTTIFLSVLGYLRVGLLEGIDMGVTGLHHYFVNPNPFDHLWVEDINVENEVYAPHTLRMEQFAVKATQNGLDFIHDVLKMIYHFPFSVKVRTLSRIIFGPHVPDTVPSISFGEEIGFFKIHLPYVHFLNTESKFINHEAWYGDWKDIITFQIEPHMVNGEGEDWLEKIYKNERDTKAKQLHRNWILSGPDTARDPNADQKLNEEINRSRKNYQLLQFRDHFALARQAQKPISARKPINSHYASAQENMLLEEIRRKHGKIDEENAESHGQFEEDGWRVVPHTYLKGYAANLDHVFGPEEMNKAKQLCLTLGPELCAGITCENARMEGCTLRDGTPEILDDGSISPNNSTREDGRRKHWSRSLIPAGDEDDPTVRAELDARARGELSADSLYAGHGSSVTFMPPGYRFLTNEKLTHVNFADNCCEEDQRKSSTTAVNEGKLHESFPKGAKHLSQEFRERNHALLTYHRHPALTKHKTPTAKIGYYVWKAFIFLQALEEAEDDDIVIWSDAGVFFLQDNRPLIARMLRGSDITGCRTVMMEGDWSKRDAFILLDMDYNAVVESNQIASSLIIARKTRLSLQLAKQWLIASEDHRIMTEEDSVLGLPEYPNYHNNNDDQTAFSLNFKKFGFLAFSTGLRDQYVLLGRNLAKFIANSNAFARGDEVGKISHEAKKNGTMTTREISQKLNQGEIEVDTTNQDLYLGEAALRDDDAVRRHRDGSFEIK